MLSTNSAGIHISESVKQVRGASFSQSLRNFAIESTLSEALPAGATIAFHNTERSSILARIPFLGSDCVPTQTDRAKLFFDWSKTDLTQDDRLSGSCDLPDRGQGHTFLGWTCGRESLPAWFERLRAALPEALEAAKFFHSQREEYRIADIGSLLRAVLGRPRAQGAQPEIYVLGNGYPGNVVGSSHSLLVVAPTIGELAQYAGTVSERIGGTLIPHAVVAGGGLHMTLGMTDLFFITTEARRSLRFDPSRYERPSLSRSGLRYLGIQQLSNLCEGCSGNG